MVDSKSGDSMVMVYSSPLEFDAKLMQAMLTDEEIPCTVENAHTPFPGNTGITSCQVFVPIQHEVIARKLVEEHEARRAEREENEPLESEGIESEETDEADV